ncbi:MAG: N-acetylneuraminate synthase [Hyphomicrobiales bacterium]|nr:N-acetylneuraminate synthase [Hyphomicrobiales bacterium]
MVSPLTIGDRLVGPGHPCYVIAEAGVNHNGDLDLAHALIDVAAGAGADAVKFQTFSTSRLVTRRAPKAQYQMADVADAETQYDMLARLELSELDHVELRDHCADLRLEFLSSPFDARCADMLHRLGVRAFKLPSGELTNLDLLRHVAYLGRPIILSTGMADLEEVRAAVDVIRGVGNDQLALLHCVSSYPTPVEACNLRAMATMAEAFDLPVGWSDHTEGTAVAVAAVALGASIVEKHLTLDRDMPGPDHKASLEPDELAELVRAVRAVEPALGDGVKRPRACEEDTAAVARKSLVAARDLVAGEILDADSVAVRRPGTGMPPWRLDTTLGRRVTTTVPAGTPLDEDMLEPS